MSEDFIITDDKTADWAVQKIAEPPRLRVHL